MISDEGLRTTYRKLVKVVSYTSTPENARNYHYMVSLLSDLSGRSYAEVHEVCIEESDTGDEE